MGVQIKGDLSDGSAEIDEYEGRDEDEEDDIFKVQVKRPERKELKEVDHTKINYINIQKSFYIESREISQMTEEEVADYRKQLGDIQVRGKDVPRPIKEWVHCGLSEIQIKILLK